MNFNKLTQILCLFSLVLVISGCATQNPFTRDSEQIGTTVCGAADNMIGKLVGQRMANAVIGQTSTVLCAGKGYYFDKQERELRKKLNATDVSITRDGDSIRLVFSSHSLFAQGNNRINSLYYPVLDSIIVVLQQYGKTRLFIQGHTDSDGSDFNNVVLSAKRAENVASYLVYKGILKTRMRIEGYGEQHPISEYKRLNRRVEIVISL